MTGATIIDGTGGTPVHDGVIVVRDGAIAEVGPRAATTIPPDVPLVAVDGKTIVPGLWDMHTHVTQVEWAPVYLAAGVTTVRDMGNEFEFSSPLRDAIAAGRALGPRIVAAGLIDGGGPTRSASTTRRRPPRRRRRSPGITTPASSRSRSTAWLHRRSSRPSARLRTGWG